MKSKNRNRAFVKSRNLNRSFIEISLISVNRMLGRLDPGDLVRLGGCSNRTYQQIKHRFTCTCASRQASAIPAGVQICLPLAMAARPVVCWCGSHIGAS